jgi:hypothetical protein
MRFGRQCQLMQVPVAGLGVLTLRAWSYLLHERNAATSGDEQDLLQGMVQIICIILLV